ncbi:MAG: protein-glutamate O-methyltransferase CheR [Nitrospirota bacterium]
MTMLLQDTTFKQLRDFIYEKSGIFIPETKKYLLEKKLLTRLEQRNLHSFEEYLPYVRSGSNGDELGKLFDAVTVNETFFFREPQQLEVFIESLTKRIIEKRSSSELKLWSAASSTGEEPYTLAMMLLEKKLFTKMEIMGSDISGEVVEAAKKGIYGSYSMRNVPEVYVQKYFTKNGLGYELSPIVKNIVRFTVINLMDEKKIRALPSMDIIFCRNVLIYFDEKAKQKVVSLLYDTLRPGGFLIIGSAESLHNITRAFRPVLFDKVVAYERV